MIIQIRGTSGSGKSTAMRRVKESLGGCQECFAEGRKQPQYYRFNNRVFILGHYETACGGCDTIGSAKNVWDIIQLLRIASVEKPRVILCEGLLLAEDTKWTIELAKTDDVRVVWLTTPMGKCVEQINQRRAAGGSDKVMTEKTINKAVTRAGTIERSRPKLEAAGVTCRRAPFDQAVRIVLNWIKDAK